MLLPSLPALLLMALLGAAAGSFAGVLADRLPRGEDVLVARSRCRSCGRALGPRDLVPVLSFAVSRGRCRTCGAAIPPWLLLMELAGAGLGMLALIAAPPGLPALALTAAVLWCLLALAAADLLWFRLPDALTASLLALALAVAALQGGGMHPTLAEAAITAAAASGVFWAIRAAYKALRGREGLGLGDVKLIAGLGALAGPPDLPLVVLLAALGALTSVLAGAAAAALRAPSPGRAEARRHLAATRPLPFGAALAAAGALVWLWRLTGN